MTVINAICQYLHDNDIAKRGVNLFKDEVPDAKNTPDPVMAVFGYPGQAAVRTQPLTQDPDDFGVSFEQPRIQVLVRGSDHDISFDLISAACAAVRRIKNTTLDVFYQSVEPLQEPYLLHRDENRRYVFVFNAEVAKRPG